MRWSPQLSKAGGRPLAISEQPSSNTATTHQYRRRSSGSVGNTPPDNISQHTAHLHSRASYPRKPTSHQGRQSHPTTPTSQTRLAPQCGNSGSRHTNAANHVQHPPTQAATRLPKHNMATGPHRHHSRRRPPRGTVLPGTQTEELLRPDHKYTMVATPPDPVPQNLVVVTAANAHQTVTLQGR